MWDAGPPWLIDHSPTTGAQLPLGTGPARYGRVGHDTTGALNGASKTSVNAGRLGVLYPGTSHRRGLRSCGLRWARHNPPRAIVSWNACRPRASSSSHLAVSFVKAAGGPQQAGQVGGGVHTLAPGLYSGRAGAAFIRHIPYRALSAVRLPDHLGGAGPLLLACQPGIRIDNTAARARSRRAASGYHREGQSRHGYCHSSDHEPTIRSCQVPVTKTCGCLEQAAGRDTGPTSDHSFRRETMSAWCQTRSRDP